MQHTAVIYVMGKARELIGYARNVVLYAAAGASTSAALADVSTPLAEYLLPQARTRDIAFVLSGAGLTPNTWETTSQPSARIKPDGDQVRSPLAHC